MKYGLVGVIVGVGDPLNETRSSQLDERDFSGDSRHLIGDMVLWKISSILDVEWERCKVSSGTPNPVKPVKPSIALSLTPRTPPSFPSLVPVSLPELV